MPRGKKAIAPKPLIEEAKVARYYELAETEKKAKNEKEPLGIEIKDVFPTKGKYEVGAYTITRGTQERVTMNEDKLLEKLKELGFRNCIVTKEAVDSAEVERMIYEGKLPSEVLSSCAEVKYVQTVSVKKT